LTSKRRGKGPRAPSAAQRPLIQALLEDRDDRALWSVLGDLLQTEGDPRGALVSMMLEREARPSPQLRDAERRHRARHLARLAPELDEEPEAVAWRRGFPSRLRVTSSETLQRVVRDPALQFLDTVALELETAEWADWLEVIEGRPQRWRRLRLDLASDGDPIELAPLLEALPALEVLRVAFAEEEPGQLDGTGARAERLRLLALRNVEHVEALEADLPALAELRLLGASEAEGSLRDSALWPRLGRVVIDVGEYGEPSRSTADTSPAVHHVTTMDDREYLTTAFMVVAQRIEPAMLGELAARISGLDHLEAAIGQVPWHPLPMTAIRLRGAGATDLLPYGLGRALEHRLSPPPAIALFAFADSPETAEAAILGAQPIHRRASYDTREALVRDVLDAAFGCDPGPDALDLLLEELDCAEPRMLIGDAGDHLELLSEIDPTAVPVVAEVDELGDDWPLWHERDLRTDRYLDEVDEPPAVTATERPPAPPIELAPAADPEEPAVVEDVPADDLASGDDPPIRAAAAGEPALLETVDGPDAWVRVDELGAEQERDPDADSVEARWPDPELAWTEIVDAATLPAPAICTRCEQPGSLRPCTWCGARHCAACAVEDERALITCASCIAEAESPPPPPPDLLLADDFEADDFEEEVPA
jgi:hypothetical protein